MRRLVPVFLVAALLGACWTGGAMAWQGRMGGMADPFGLVEDESDFLIHPSKIADGKDMSFYGDFKFLYRDVSDWSYRFGLRPPVRILGNPIAIPGLGLSGGYSGSGDEQVYDAMVGMAMPAGPGRFGFFFNYEGTRGDYDGAGAFSGSALGFGASLPTAYNLDSSMDSFKGRFLYGMPLGDGLKLGAELEVAYRSDENDTAERIRSFTFNNVNFDTLFQWNDRNGFLGTLFPFMYPQDSEYWEIVPKIGLTGAGGPVKWAATVRGGAIFGGENEWSSSQSLSVDPSAPPINAALSVFDVNHSFKLDGDVDGWKVGGDFWLRYALSPCNTLPFLLRIDYREISRDGTGSGLLTGAFRNPADDGSLLGLDPFAVPLNWAYDSKEEVFEIETGGGLEYVPNGGLRIAGGLYYKYIDSTQTAGITPSVTIPIGIAPIASVTAALPSSYDPGPETTEHQIIMRLAAEQMINACWTLRGGLNGFVGWVDEDLTLATSLVPTGLDLVTVRSSLSGTRWGILGAIGASAKFDRFLLEPFIQGGYQSYEPDGPADFSVLNGVLDADFDVDKERSEAIIGGGISFRF